MHEQIKLEMEEIRNLLTGELLKQFQSAVDPAHPIERSRASSSSSSLRSFSVGSPEHSSMVLNLSNSPNFQVSMRNQASIPIGTSNLPQLYALPPVINMDDLAVTKAMLAVLSSPVSQPHASSSPSSSSSSSPSAHLSMQTGAFRRYSRALSPSMFIRKSRTQSQSLLKLSVVILRGINQQRIQAQLGETKPASSQLSHVMSERKRREKLNESFLALRSILPLGSKVRILKMALWLLHTQFTHAFTHCCTSLTGR